jgi:predicted XRE-type DNA-binding protein
MSSNYVVGSGNVYVDLGFENPEGAQAKANIVRALAGIIKERKLTQAEAGKLIGVTQGNLSRLLSGDWDGYTYDRLLRFANTLGRNVRIIIETSDVERGITVASY